MRALFPESGLGEDSEKEGPGYVQTYHFTSVRALFLEPGLGKDTEKEGPGYMQTCYFTSVRVTNKGLDMCKPIILSQFPPSFLSLAWAKTLRKMCLDMCKPTISLQRAPCFLCYAFLVEPPCDTKADFTRGDTE